MKNLSRVFQKQKKKRKKNTKRLSFITQFKIEFLLPLTGCRKVLGKMPENGISFKRKLKTLKHFKILLKLFETYLR